MRCKTLCIEDLSILSGLLPSGKSCINSIGLYVLCCLAHWFWKDERCTLYTCHFSHSLINIDIFVQVSIDICLCFVCLCACFSSLNLQLLKLLKDGGVVWLSETCVPFEVSQFDGIYHSDEVIMWMVPLGRFPSDVLYVNMVFFPSRRKCQIPNARIMGSTSTKVIGFLGECVCVCVLFVSPIIGSMNDHFSGFYSLSFMIQCFGLSHSCVKLCTIDTYNHLSNFVHSIYFDLCAIFREFQFHFKNWYIEHTHPIHSESIECGNAYNIWIEAWNEGIYCSIWKSRRHKMSACRWIFRHSAYYNASQPLILVKVP